MAKARKRKPGGGRKPKGYIRGKAANFSTRITGATRDALEREAAESGQSISQAAERLLMLGIEARRRRAENKPLRALGFLIEAIALDLTSGRILANADVDEWRTHPFLFRAFRIAVDKLLGALEPAGEVKPYFLDKNLEILSEVGAKETGFDAEDIRDTLARTFASPETLANFTIQDLWRRLNRTSAGVDSDMKYAANLGRRFHEMQLQEAYGLDDARRDLAISKG